jgi:UDP-glucose 4-epimerase
MALFVVTGGAGFIGSHLADALLARGHEVCVLDDFSTGHRSNLDSRCSLVRGDVADPLVVRSALEGAAGCFHLAAIASVARGQEDWSGTHRVNAGGTVAVLDAARACGHLPVVYASSAAVYGDVAVEPAREDRCPAPQTAYGADKLASELHGRVAFLTHTVPTLGLRFFNVYGPRQDANSPYSGVISLFSRLVAQDATVTIHGDGEQTRDFVFVADVVLHLLSAMDRLRSRTSGSGAEVMNVCTGHGTSVRAMAASLGDLLGRTPKIQHGPLRPGDIRHSVGDPSRAITALSVRAETPVRAGLAALLRWQDEAEQVRSRSS